MRLIDAPAAPVIMFIAPGPTEDVQAYVRSRLLCRAKAAARWTWACSFCGRK